MERFKKTNLLKFHPFKFTRLRKVPVTNFGKILLLEIIFMYQDSTHNVSYFCSEKNVHIP
jgi:hypothetical protein